MSIHTRVFLLLVYRGMTRTKQTARKTVTDGPVATNVRYVENPAYISSVKGTGSTEKLVLDSEDFKCQIPPSQSQVFKCQTPPPGGDVWKCQTPPVESDVFKCRTPPVESSAVERMDVWKCERYKKKRYDPLTTVRMKGDKVKPFLYGRVVVFKLTVKYSSRV